MRRLIFEETSFDDFIEWSEGNRKSAFKRLVKLIAEVRRTPFEGTGKPEPLKENLSGYWSRRITDEHRLVYKVTDEAIVVIACKNHY